MEELDIRDLFYYCTDLTVDGKQLPDAPSVYMYQVESLIDEAETSENCPQLSQGDGFVYIGKNVGDWASFPIDAKAGTYKLEVLLKQHENKGIFQLYINDEPVGEPYDQYYKGNKTGVTKDFGTVTFAEGGTQQVKFEVVGKNAASGSYQLVIDAVKLTEIDVPKTKLLEAVEIEELPEKLTYYAGDEADYTGLQVVAVYDDDSREILTEEQYIITGFDSTEPALITIVVEYEGKTAEFEVEIVEKREETGKAGKAGKTRRARKTGRSERGKGDYRGIKRSDCKRF